MSRSRYVKSTLSALVDSDSDDTKFVEVGAMPTPESATENMPVAKRGRGRPKAGAAKTTKAKAPARRISRSKTVAVKKGKRAPLSDKTNEQIGASETEEVEEFEQQDTVLEDAPSEDELDVSVAAFKQPKPRVTKGKSTTKVGQVVKDATTRTHHTIDASPSEDHVLESYAAAGPKKRSSRQPPEVIQETQESLMDIADDGDEEIDEPTLRVVARHKNISKSTSQSRQTPLTRRRAGSASDTERNDPAIRRKLGELNKKYENLDLKYRNVREIGIKEAEQNFDRFKKQSEESNKAANALIASLKSDIASQNKEIRESRELKKDIDNQAAEIQKLKAEVAQLTSCLNEARAENKTFSAKLAANRSAASSVESAISRTPGSAMKANGGIRMMGSAEAAQQVQSGQLKEDLYGDLTGLIIRSVKREAEEDVYDCIQTGRNGTLHFKLAAANEKSAESFEDAQCVYVPLLDPPRDKALMEMLPDYLVDEITFPRQQAAKFYSRVSEALTKKQG